MMLHFVFRNSHWFVLYIEHWLTLTLDMQWRHHSLTVFLSLHASLAQNRTKAKINGKTQIQAYCHQTAPESSVMISTNNVEYENSQFFFLIWFLLNICWSLQIDSICLDVATGSVPMDDTWWRCLRQWENSYFYAWLKFFLLFTAMFCSCEQKINCNSVSPIKTAYWIGHKELFPTISIDSYSQRDFRSLASSFLCQCENKDKIFIFLLVFIFPFLLLSCYLYRRVEFRSFPNLLIFHFALITQNICNILVLSHNNFQSFFLFWFFCLLYSVFTFAVCSIPLSSWNSIRFLFHLHCLALFD